jgi:hypothetical protein
MRTTFAALVSFGWLLVFAAGPACAGDAKAGEAIIARAVDALGGAPLVDRILTLSVTAKATRTTPNGVLKTPTRTFIEFPASFRQEIEINGSIIAMASSPDGAILIAPDHVQPLSDAQRQNLEVTALRIPLVMLKGRRSALFGADANGKGKVGDVEVDFVDVFVGNEQMRIAVEKSSGRILQQEFDTRGGVPERMGRMIVTYSDFRRIPYGITIPHSSVGRFEGEVAFESVIESVRVNDKLKEDLFRAIPGDQPSRSTQPAPKP